MGCKMRKPLLLTAGMLCASSVCANAVGFSTQLNCASDYYAYCSKYSVGSPELRRCMRANGPKLSRACINALIADGEISKEEVAQQKAKFAAAKAKPKLADFKKSDMDPKGQTKTAPSEPKMAAKLATAPPPPKPQPAKQAIARAAEPQASVEPKTEAVSQMVSIDKKTFEALKTRGPRFLDAENDIVAAQPLQQRAAVQHADDALGDVSERAEAEAAGLADAGDVVTKMTTEPESQTDVAQVVDEPPAKILEYPPGRMSLGHKLSTARDQAQPVSWWDKIVGGLFGW